MVRHWRVRRYRLPVSQFGSPAYPSAVAVAEALKLRSRQGGNGDRRWRRSWLAPVTIQLTWTEPHRLGTEYCPRATGLGRADGGAGS
jgi:hypothetical protein